MGNAVRLVLDLDLGFGQTREAAEMGSEPIQGSSAACGSGFAGRAFLALGGGEGRYTVTFEDILQCFAGLVPYFARGAEGGVGNVAHPTCRAASGTDLTVEDLDDVENGDLLRGHREAVAPVRPAAALYDISPAKLAEDLLEKPLRDVLAAGQLGYPERAIALVERQLHKRPNRILALLRKPQEIITRSTEAYRQKRL
jgi:hypothetical protein